MVWGLVCVIGCVEMGVCDVGFFVWRVCVVCECVFLWGGCVCGLRLCGVCGGVFVCVVCLYCVWCGCVCGVRMICVCFYVCFGCV